MHTRYPAVEGSFYPETISECHNMIENFRTKVPQTEKIYPRALIVPHAGWVYSGLTATYAYEYLKSFKGKRIIMLAPSHHVGFSELSIGDYDYYLFNGKNVHVDKEYISHLKEQFDLNFYEQAHKYEHSDEVQLPFLEYYLDDYKIVNLIYSYESYQTIIPIIKSILSDPENLLIISTDLSHYHSQAEANRIDENILIGVQKFDLFTINQGEACGKTGILAVVSAAADLKMQVKLLDYRTSGDVSGDFSRVVGYASFIYF